MDGSTRQRQVQLSPRALLVGIDPHQAQHTVVIMTQEGQVVTKFKVPTTREGFVRLQQRVGTAMDRTAAPGAVYGIEAGAHYWSTLAAFLEQAGETVCLLNPFTLKRRREGDDLERRKNDFRDAAMAATLLRSGSCRPYRPPRGVYAELRAEYAAYRRLQAQRTRSINLLRSLLAVQFPEFRLIFKDVLGQTALAVLAVSSDPQVLVQGSADALVPQVRAQFSGTRLMQHKVRALHQVAGSSVGIRHGAAAMAAEVRQVLAQVRLLQAQVQASEGRLTDLVQQTPEYEWLHPIRGSGPLSVAGVLAETGPLRQYRSARAVIKLAGTQPTQAESAGKAARHTPMSKKGRPRLRHCLWLIAVQLLRHAPEFQRWAAQLQQRTQHPLQRREAIGAVANRFVRVAFALVRDGVAYQPAPVAAVTPEAA